MSTETAITVIVPKDLNEATSLAQKLSKSSLLPAELRGKEPDILMTIMTGAELGLAPMQSIRAIDVIKGKPCLKAEAMVALVRRRRDVCEFFNIVHSDEKKCVIEAKRVGGAPIKLTFSIEDAQRANLLSNDNWKRFPAAMLRARCSSAVCKAEFSDLILGLYDPDELRAEMTPAERAVAQHIDRVVDVTPAAPQPTPAPAPKAHRMRIVDETPAPQPSPPQALPAPSPDAELEQRLESAVDLAGLNALVPALGSLKGKSPSYERLRARWGERRAELQQAAQEVAP